MKDWRGVRHGPLTPVEMGTLLALSEGMTPTQLADATKIKSVRTVWRRMARMRFKLDCYTSFEMMYKVGKDGILD